MQSPDGVAVIGETLWIRGRSFGRQPAVTVGGRPAAVLGRTRDGGIVVRVPPATPSGSQPVVVSNEVGRGERPIAVRRYAAVLAPGAGEIGWAELGADGPIAAGATAVARRALAGAVVRRARRLPRRGDAIDRRRRRDAGAGRAEGRLPAGSRQRADRRAGGRRRARRCWRSCARTTCVLLDTTSPLRPARSAPRALPPEIARRARRRRRPVARRQAAGGRHRRRATASRCSISVPRGRAAAGRRAGDRARRPRERAGRRRVLARGRHAVGAVGRHAAQPRESDRSRPSCARCGWARSPREPDASSRSRASSTIGGGARSGAHRRRPRAAAGQRRGDPPAARARDGVLRRRRQTAARRQPATSRAATPAATAPDEAAVFRVGAEDAATVAIAAVGRLGMPDLSFDGRWLLAPVARAGRRGARAVGGRRRPAGARARARSTSSRAGPGEAPPGGAAAAAAAHPAVKRVRASCAATCRASVFAPRPPHEARRAGRRRLGPQPARRQRRGRGRRGRRGRRCADRMAAARAFVGTGDRGRHR